MIRISASETGAQCNSNCHVLVAALPEF